MSAPIRMGYSRLETDEELLARVGGARLNYETVDQHAERFGKQRRIIEVLP